MRVYIRHKAVGMKRHPENSGCCPGACPGAWGAVSLLSGMATAMPGHFLGFCAPRYSLRKVLIDIYDGIIGWINCLCAGGDKCADLVVIQLKMPGNQHVENDVGVSRSFDKAKIMQL